MKFQRHQFILLGLLGLTFIGMLGGWSILNSQRLGICPLGSYTCPASSLVDGVGFPLHYTNTWPLALVFFLLLFVRKEIFSWWWKFALPAGVYLIYGVISTSPNAGFSIFGGRSEYTHLLTSLFAVYSISIVFVTYVGYWLYAVWVKRKAGN